MAAVSHDALSGLCARIKADSGTARQRVERCIVDGRLAEPQASQRVVSSLIDLGWDVDNLAQRLHRATVVSDLLRLEMRKALASCIRGIALLNEQLPDNAFSDDLGSTVAIDVDFGSYDDMLSGHLDALSYFLRALRM